MKMKYLNTQYINIGNFDNKESNNEISYLVN